MTPARQAELLESVERALDEAVHVRRRSNLLVKMLGNLKDQLNDNVESPEADDNGRRAEHPQR